MGPVVLILRWTCCNGNVSPGRRGVGLGVSSSGFHWVTLFCSLKAFSTDGQDQYVPCSLGLELKVSTLYSLVSLHRRAINHLSCVPGFCQYPVFTLPVSKFCFFLISSSPLNFKAQNFRDSHGWTHTNPLGAGLVTLFVVYQPVPGKWSHDYPKVWSLCQNIAESQLWDLLLLTSYYAWYSAAFWRHPFFLWPEDPQTMCHSWNSAPLCHLSTFKPGMSPTVADF